MSITQDTGATEQALGSESQNSNNTVGASNANSGSVPKPKQEDGADHGQTTYPGPRANGAGDTSATPAAGDTDKGSSDSAEETGQVNTNKGENAESGNPYSS